jgi:hypothetical protein
MPTKRNYSRLYKAQCDDRERRLQALAKYRAEGRKLCDFAKEVGIDIRTAQRDQKEYVKRLVAMSNTEIDFERQRQFHEIGELKTELQVLRTRLAQSEGLPTKDRLQIALQIIDRDVDIMKRESELLGLDAPTKTESKNLNVNLDAVDPATLPEYRRWLYETRFMDAAQKEKAFQLIRGSGLNKHTPVAVEPPKSSPLWNEPKRLEGEK